MNITNIVKYLAHLNGIDNVNFDKDVKIEFDGKNTIIKKWDLPFNQPTVQEIALVESLANEYVDPLAYILERKYAYPNVQSQLLMIYSDMKNNTNTFVDAIDAINAQYPAP